MKKREKVRGPDLMKSPVPANNSRRNNGSQIVDDSLYGRQREKRRGALDGTSQQLSWSCVVFHGGKPVRRSPSGLHCMALQVPSSLELGTLSLIGDKAKETLCVCLTYCMVR